MLAARHSLLVEALCLCLLVFGVRPAETEVWSFNNPQAWATWDIPYGLVAVGDRGQLELVRFRKDINPVGDAAQFSHTTLSRDQVSGGIWEAGSNPRDAEKIMDGDPQTFWKPSPDDQLAKWYVDIDLGRPVLAREVRLVFPQEERAHPFRQFTVFASQGSRIQADDDVFQFEPIYRTTLPNYQTSITIPLEYLTSDSTLVLDEDLGLDWNYESRYRVIQYISIEVDEKSEDAALAEVEVLAVGDNIALGTLKRGSLISGETTTNPQNMFDGDMNTFGLVTSSHTTSGSKGGWKPAGVWWGVDLGAKFWLDGLFFYYQARGEGLAGAANVTAGSGHEILYSDGQQAIQTTLPLPDAFDYTTLVIQNRLAEDKLYQIRYLFKPRQIRYLFWHGTSDQGWNTRPLEIMLFADGYPAEVVLRSDFLDLGKLAGDGRPKVIRHLLWEADLPARTTVELRSRSGNSLEPMYTFYDKKGDQVTEAKWNSLPKVVRGSIDTTVVVGNDWDEWSTEYKFSGQVFQSESPRRFVQLELLLSTEDPQVTPVLHSLSVEFEEALVQETRGLLLPRQVRPNEATRFTYTLWTSSTPEDSGFDLLRFTVPEPVEVDDIALQIGDRTIVPTAVSMEADSLFLALPEKVLADSLQVSFSMRVLQNASVVDLDLGDQQRPGLWQSVEAVDRQANIVFLPDLPGSDRLIGNLEVSTPVITPNGDGINDEVEIRFVTFKVEAATPRVEIRDMAGRQVAVLNEVFGGMTRTFIWSGRDLTGELVEPGIYLCRINLGAKAGDDTELRSVAVAY